MEFDKIIDNIRDTIIEQNVHVFKQTTDIKTEAKKEKLSANMLKSNQYALESIKRKQDYLVYKRNIKKDPTKLQDSYNLMNKQNLSNILENLEYNKKWIKLDLYQKKQQLSKYIDELISKDVLNIKYKEELLNKLKIDLLNKKIKNNNIDYEQNKQKIISISNLEILEDKSYRFM